MSAFGWSYPPGCSGPPGDDYDETRCYHCAAKLPEDPQEGTPAWDGFCTEACRDGKQTPCARPMFDFLCAELQRDTPEGWDRALYKATSCGAWLALSENDLISMGSIVEGVEQCATDRHLRWPFTAEEFWACAKALEDEVDEIWNATHGCETCAKLAGGAGEYGPCDGNDGMTPVCPECPECGGGGTPI